MSCPLLATQVLKLSLVDPLLLIVGIVCLYYGADFLVRGAYRWALRLGMTPAVAGLTIVALATSMPEVIASFTAQLSHGLGNIALGNIVGSNIANIGLIVGLAALIRPLSISRLMRVREIPIMLGVLILLWLFSFGEVLGRIGGGILFVGFIVYIWFQVWRGRHEGQAWQESETKDIADMLHHRLIDLGLIILGTVLLVIGGEALIRGAIGLARAAGISERVVGLTVVAVGTSLPELAVTVIAAFRGYADIALGNVVGSNTINTLLIGGGLALCSPIHFNSRLHLVDMVVMIFFAALLWALTWVSSSIRRWGGSLVLAIWVIYIAGAFVFQI